MIDTIKILAIIFFLIIPLLLNYKGYRLIADFHPTKIDRLPDNKISLFYTTFFLPILIIGILIAANLYLRPKPWYGLIVLSIPIALISLYTISYFINYRSKTSIKEALNDSKNQKLKLKLIDNSEVTLFKDNIKLVYDYHIHRNWGLPWSRYSFDRIVLKDDSELIINNLEVDVGLLNLLFTHYEITVIGMEQFTNRIKNNTDNV